MANLKTKKYFYTPQEALGGRIGDHSKHQFGNYGTDNPRPNLMKAAHIPTDRMLQKIDGRSPDYYGLEPVVDEDAAKIMLAMGLRKPKTFEEIQELTGFDKDYLNYKLEEMGYYGVVEWDWENPQKVKKYSVKNFVPGSAEILNEHPEWYEDHPEFAEMFELSTYLPFAGFGPLVLTQMIPEVGAGSGIQFIPV